MAITVDTTPDYAPDLYPNGTKWVIDDDGRLHIVGSDGNIASYNYTQWSSVRHTPATT